MGGEGVGGGAGGGGEKGEVTGKHTQTLLALILNHLSFSNYNSVRNTCMCLLLKAAKLFSHHYSHHSICACWTLICIIIKTSPSQNLTALI